MTGTEVLIAATLAQAGMSAISAIQQGNAAKAAADFNSQVARNNAIASRDAAAAKEDRLRREARRRIGAQRAAYGASGVQFTGTALDVLSDSVMEAELDAQTALYEGETQALGFESEASLEQARGRNAQRAGYMSAASSLLSGGTQAYGTIQGFGGSLGGLGPSSQ